MTQEELMTMDEAVDSPSCWKASDLRGVYPEEISFDLFLRIGGAIGTMLGGGARVLLAGDFRLSTPLLKDALMHGLTGTGVDVIDSGQIPTPVAYFAATVYKPDAVLIVTASHNPPEQNGLKLLFGGRPPTPDQLAHIRKLSLSNAFSSGKGTLTSIAPLGQYEQYMIERWQQLDPSILPNLVLDAGNGAWSESAPRVFSALKFHIQCLSCVIDGRFPDRPSDCSRSANIFRLREQVSQQPNTLGIAWDGDGDRVAFVDETGHAVSADQLSMLLTRELFASKRSETTGNNSVVVDLKLASAVQKEVLRVGGLPLLERTGHAFMRTRMISTGARLGLDACGHFFFGELQGADDGLFAALLVLELLQRAQLPLSELVKGLPSIYGTPELRIPLRLLAFKHAEYLLLGSFSDAAVDRLDGIRITLPDGAILLRESGTEAVLSLRIEGDTQARCEMLLALCLDLLPTARAYIEAQLQEHLTPVER
jgi:phosphomannomutase / phosphoglucomutase